MALAAMAAVVGCAKEQMPANVENGIDIVASISVDETRVTVEGEKFTDVKWEAGDAVTLCSVAGASATLNATEAGDTDVRFTGEGVLVADVDTYYAVYPATTIGAGVVSFNLATQSGDDAAILVAKAENAQRGAIEMNFTPANSLLHVAVSGVEALAKAEFKAYNGTAVPSVFTYSFVDGMSVATQGVEALVVENPAVEGFFFSLPADLDMTDGYVVSLTDAQGNVCSKAYNGKVFEKGTTTRVDIEWSMPVVTLGVPMTSYSYYVAGNSATANSCANNVIYFEGVSSTYANIQNAMVVEAGFIVDGKEYVATIDKASKSFSMGNVTVSSWGAKSVEAYIKTKDGAVYKSAAQSVQITGLPYSYNFVNGSLDGYSNDGWTTVGQLSVSNETLAGHDTTLVLHHYRKVGSTDNKIGYIVSPMFNVPGSIAVQPQLVRHCYAYKFSLFGGSGTINKSGNVGATSSQSAKSSSPVTCTDTSNYSTDDATSGSGEWLSSFYLTSDMPYISVSCSDNTYGTATYYFVYSVQFRYLQ